MDDAWAQNTLPDDDISIPQVLPPAAPEGGGPGGAPAGSGCRACARHGALAPPPQGHDVPSDDEAEEADGAGAGAELVLGWRDPSWACGVWREGRGVWR